MSCPSNPHPPTSPLWSPAEQARLTCLSQQTAQATHDRIVSSTIATRPYSAPVAAEAEDLRRQWLAANPVTNTTDDGTVLVQQTVTGRAPAPEATTRPPAAVVQGQQQLLAAAQQVATAQRQRAAADARQQAKDREGERWVWIGGGLAAAALFTVTVAMRRRKRRKRR